MGLVALTTRSASCFSTERSQEDEAPTCPCVVKHPGWFTRVSRRWEAAQGCPPCPAIVLPVIHHCLISRELVFAAW